jgi:phage baseplate assembly protein W
VADVDVWEYSPATLEPLTPTWLADVFEPVTAPLPVAVATAPALAYLAEYQPAAIDYGWDILTFPDLDVSFTPVNSARILSEALAKRFSTPTGKLFFHPDYGLDLREYLNSPMTDTLLIRIKSAVEIQAIQDERIFEALSTVSYDAASSTLLVQVDATSAFGPFSMVLAVTSVTVELILGKETS